MADKRSPFRVAFGELMGENHGGTSTAAEPVVDGSLAQDVKPPESIPQDNAPIRLPEETVRPCSVIEEDLVITGSIKSKGNIVMKGCVRGDIICGGKLTVQGMVIGDVRAESIDMQSARVKGETRCGGRLEIDENSTLLGNVIGGDSAIRGKVRGNVTSNGAMDVAATSIIVGDLTFETLELHSGAVVSGRLISEKAKDVDLAFQDMADSFGDME